MSKEAEALRAVLSVLNTDHSRRLAEIHLSKTNDEDEDGSRDTVNVNLKFFAEGAE